MSNNGNTNPEHKLGEYVVNGINQLGQERDELLDMLLEANELIAAQRAIIEEMQRRTWRPTPAESAEWRRMMKRGKK